MGGHAQKKKKEKRNARAKRENQVAMQLSPWDLLILVSAASRVYQLQ